MTDKSLVLKRLTPANMYLAEPVPLRGSDIDRLASLRGLHKSQVSFALGINTAALYTKANSEDQLSPSLSILLRLLSAFPQLLPDLAPPPPDELVAKIKAIDPTFEKRSLGPLLGLGVNSSHRIIRGGSDRASMTAQHLMYYIDQIVTHNPEGWPAVRAIVEIEADSRKVPEPESIWETGAWKKDSAQEEAPTETTVKLVRRKKL